MAALVPLLKPEPVNRRDLRGASISRRATAAAAAATAAAAAYCHFP